MSLSKFKQFLKNFQFEDVSDESEFLRGDYIDETLSKTWRGSGRDWEISLKKEGKERLGLKIEVSETEEDSEKHIEFQYAVFLTHKNSLKLNTIKISGRAIINEESNPIFRSYHTLSLFHELRGVSIKDMYMLFAVDIVVFHDKDGIRNLYLGYQHDMPELPRVTVDGKEICLPMRALKRRTPLFAKAFEDNEISEKMKKYLEVFIQVILGVQVQLKEKEIKPLLKLATEYKVLNVKRYCENQLIWRDELGFSIQQKYKIACKYNLNILMKMDYEVSKSGVRVELADKTIWKKFYPNTEMITKKVGGRIIFPHLEYRIKGLQADCRYKIYLFVERADNEKYTFDCGQWQSIKKGKGTKPPPIQFKEHPSGARLGSHWMKEKVSFSHLRLTTDPNNKDNRMILAQGMHRYLPVVMIQKVGDESVYPEQFRLRLTEFYAVSAYQSQEMVDLKVAHNKYASWVGKEGKTENPRAVPTNSQFDNINVEPAPSRHSTYSKSNSSTPASVTPPTGEHVLEPPSPMLFNQNGYPNNFVQMPNQFYDYYGMMHLNPYYWNHYPQNYGAPIDWNAGANMNQFNTQNFF